MYKIGWKSETTGASGYLPGVYTKEQATEIVKRNNAGSAPISYWVEKAE